MTRLTGWCATDLPHPRDHQTCQERQDAGLLDPCGCTMHGGHVRASAPAPVHTDEPPTKREVAA